MSPSDGVKEATRHAATPSSSALRSRRACPTSRDEPLRAAVCAGCGSSPRAPDLSAHSAHSGATASRSPSPRAPLTGGADSAVRVAKMALRLALPQSLFQWNRRRKQATAAKRLGKIDKFLK